MTVEATYPAASDLHRREVAVAAEGRGAQLVTRRGNAVDLDLHRTSRIRRHRLCSSVACHAAYYGRGMDEKLVSEYLQRIDVARPESADAAALRSLHRAHQLAVPFENLSIHLAEPISLAEDELIDKVVTRRRGGFCYELNGAFALLLQALGFEVRRVAARVYGDGRLGPPFDHLALVVRAVDGSGPWLADVGFGSHSTYPLLAGQQAAAGGSGRPLPDRRDCERRPGRAQGRRAAVPGRAAGTDARRLRSHLLVAADLAAVPLHAQRHLLAD